MSQQNESPDLELPEEILALIPTDPYDQLDLARKITCMAIASRVSRLDSEVGYMRQKLLDKDRLIQQLEDKAARLENGLLDAQNKLKIVLDENMKLSKERDTLTMTTKKLGRDLAKLETFKRQLMQSLNEENSPHAESVDIGTCGQSMPKAYPDSDVGSVQQLCYKNSSDAGKAIDEAYRNTAQRFSLTPYITPRLTPTGTPTVSSTCESPRGYSAAESPRLTSGTASPTFSSYDGKSTMSSWYSSSQQSSAANSPPRGRSLLARAQRIDGKEFFRRARNRLSYEQFSGFLANIKELNAQKQTREETLRKAEEIFGTDNKDLYISFQALLNRSIR